jgi:hypothetical protein
MGGILGGLYAAIAPDAGAVVLNVGGGGLTRVLASETLYPRIEILVAPQLGLSVADHELAAALPLFNWLAQTLLDPGDPINFGSLVIDAPPAHARTQRHVLLQVGLGDGLVPNETSQALADAIGLAAVDSAQSNASGVDAVWWVDLADYGIEPEPGGSQDPHNIVSLVDGVRIQAGRYLASEGRELVVP